MSSIDEILAQLKAEYQGEKGCKGTPQPAPESQSQPVARPPVDRLLAEVQAEYVERDRVEALLQQQHQQAAEHQRRQFQQQRDEAMKRRAEQWLKALDRFSDEGMWFEQFAEAYPSPMEAAIDYLQALDELRHSST